MRLIKGQGAAEPVLCLKKHDIGLLSLGLEEPSRGIELELATFVPAALGKVLAYVEALSELGICRNFRIEGFAAVLTPLERATLDALAKKIAGKEQGGRQ